MQEKRHNSRSLLQAQLVINRLDEKEATTVDIFVQDLSKSGMGFISSSALEIGAVYEAYLTIWTKEVIHAFVEIVRVDKSAVGDSIYGGFFVGLPATEAARIEIYQTFENNPSL